jgi:hypothetical protein
VPSWYDARLSSIGTEVSLLYRFIRAVIHHWGSLVTSGAIIGAIGIWQATGHPVSGYVYWAIAGVGLLIAFYLARQEEHIAAAIAKPFAEIRFAYDRADTTACLYVKNTGVVADFFAQLRIPYEREDVHARWSHTNDVRTRIPTGIERKLLLAKLHYTLGPVSMSQWEIFYTREGRGIGSQKATYSSAIGIPDAQAPDINLEVIVASDPDMRGGVQSKRIVLHSNRAEEV